MHWVMAATLVCGVSLFTACSSNDDNSTTSSQQEMEENLIGLWTEEFKYEDVTEAGKPFNRALIVVEAKADHTGYMALAVFDDEFNEPLEVYGGPKDAPFTWQVNADGKITLSATRGAENPNSMVNPGQVNMTCTQGG